MLIHKTVTLHVHMLYKRREGAKSEPLFLLTRFPACLPLIRSLWTVFAPEVRAGQGLHLPLLTALCPLQHLDEEVIPE